MHSHFVDPRNRWYLYLQWCCCRRVRLHFFCLRTRSLVSAFSHVISALWKRSGSSVSLHCWPAFFGINGRRSWLEKLGLYHAFSSSVIPRITTPFHSWIVALGWQVCDGLAWTYIIKVSSAAGFCSGRQNVNLTGHGPWTRWRQEQNCVSKVHWESMTDN